MLRSQKISAGPRYVQTAAENCRGVGAFLCGAWFRFGTDYVQNALYKTLDPAPFLASSAISERLGLGMRLARVPYPSARHPYSALCPPPLTGVARASGGRAGGRAADGEGRTRAALDGG